MERLIYLDHAATSPMRPEAVAAMVPFLTERFGNTGGNYRLGRDARRAVDDARDRVAAAIGCTPGEVVFTSGGTESDNAVVRSRAGECGRPVCSAVEHHAVLDPVVAASGTVVGVDDVGRVDLDALSDALVATPASVVSVMAVNNEIGTVNDLAGVAAVVRRLAPATVLHTDAVQAPGWIDLPSVWRHVDALSLSAHKFGGPKGVGVVALRDGVPFAPLVVGGGQERDRRSGTHDVGGIVATAVALELATADRELRVAAVAARRDALVDRLVAADVDIVETVAAEHKTANHAHVLVGGIETETLLFLLDAAGVCASAASACASGALEPSHVLTAIGIDFPRAAGALRLTLGPDTTDADIEFAADTIVGAVRTVRERRRQRTEHVMSTS